MVHEHDRNLEDLAEAFLEWLLSTGSRHGASHGLEFGTDLMHWFGLAWPVV